jgi:RHS repeat-associated protein
MTRTLAPTYGSRSTRCHLTLSFRAARGICFFLLALLFLASLPSSAQYPATGTPASGSFGGGPDVINLGNLNAHLDIPIVRKPGRGTNFTYDLTYDSSVWVPAGSSGSQSWQLFLNNSTVLGWQGFNGVQPGGIVYTLTITYSSPHASCSVTAYEYSNFSYWDNSGTQHPFPYSLSGAWVVGSGEGGCPPTGPQPAPPWSGTATDGSSYTVSVTPSAGNPPTLSATLLDKNGKTIYAAVAQQPPPSGFSQDRNGNLITPNNGALTDTLGTTALTLFGVAPNNTTLSYTAPSGSTVFYTVKYTSYTVQTNFGCSGISEYGPISNYLVSEIDLPDIAVNPNDKYLFAYESTPGHTSNVTGRVKQITLPTGGTISYTYTSGNLTGSAVGSTDPIVCADGTTAGLERSTPDTGANYWNYARTQVSGKHWQTTITDPTTNQTVIDFQQDSNTYGGYNFFETQRKTYQGSSSGTLLQTVISCYNGTTTNCPTTAVSSPFTQKTLYTQWPSGLESENNFLFNTYGLTTEEDDYDYGPGAPGGLLRKTLTTYASLGNGIVSMPASIIVQNTSGSTVSEQTFAYDQGTLTTTSGTPQHSTTISGSRGNVTTANYYTNSSAYLTKNFTYFDTGNVQTATDVNLGVTTYTYSSASASCGNSFPTGVTEAITTLTQSATWNCTGGVQLTSVDENNQTTTTLYNDAYFWRPASVTDPAGAVTSSCYGLLSSSTGSCTANSNQSESTLNLNSNNSTVDSLTTADGLGRQHVQQTRQSPSSTTFDSIETDYDALGRPNRTTMPYNGTSGQTNSSAPAVATTYDALGRVLSTTDANGGTTTYSYSNNDVLVTVGPAPSGENTKQRQLEYNGLGQLTSVCEITVTLSGYGTCSQSNSQTGYWTKYTYDALGDLLTVTQNAQSTSNQQTRTYAYDEMSRLTSETNPESGTTAYTYDSNSTCTPASSGDLVKRVDALGNISCFTYDALHRPLTVTYPSGSYASVTLSKHFVYDAATVNSVAMAYPMSRLAEAYTTSSSCTSKCTDIGFSYTQRGEITSVYQSTPHSGGYYNVSQTYWPHGAPSQLSSSITGLPTISYGGTIGSTVGLDGEGRITQVTASGTGQQNPVTGVTYNNSSLPTQVNFGSGDNDIFAYDPNTMRTTQYQFNINGQSSTGALTWNPNGSMQKLVITDAFNSSDNQTCYYGNPSASVAGYDDLSRLISANCGSAAAQTFSYDPFGNINKAGSPYSFNATYSATSNRITCIGGSGSNCSGGVIPTYDANGNVTMDSLHTYAWDSDGNSITLDGIGLTFDALDRMVEQNRSGTYTQIVYAPTGDKLALMSGQSLSKAFVPLPGQATAVYTSSGLDHYRHSDWLGSARLTSSPTRTVLSTSAYAPFGEPYAQTGTADLSFTGQNADTTSTSTSEDYDFLSREYSIQGRWPSPDPAGLAAASPGYPQSWNRYAYVLNNPLALIDPQGLDCVYDSYVNGAVGEYEADSGVFVVPGDCVSEDDDGVYYPGTIFSVNYVDPNDDFFIVTLDNGNTLCGGIGCASDTSVTVTADPDAPWAVDGPTTIGPETDWFRTKQAGCVASGLKQFVGGLVLKKEIDATIGLLLGASPDSTIPQAVTPGSVAVPAEISLESVAGAPNSRPIIATLRTALREQGWKVSGNALAEGAKFLGHVALGVHIAFAANDGNEAYRACMAN